MKTIDEAAKECSWHAIGNESHFTKEEIFKYGVKFAQRWIPVDEDLPNVPSFVIVKKRNGLKLGMFFDSEKQFLYGFENQTSQITHWRPITLN